MKHHTAAPQDNAAARIYLAHAASRVQKPYIRRNDGTDLDGRVGMQWASSDDQRTVRSASSTHIGMQHHTRNTWIPFKPVCRRAR